MNDCYLLQKGNTNIFLNNSVSSLISRILFPDFRRDSYHLSGSDVAVRIYQPTHADTPLRRIGASNSKIGTYLVFQPVRFTMPRLSPTERWALTPPFRPYPISNEFETWRFAFCCTCCQVIVTNNLPSC
jgi:hypothetical protein